MQPYWQVHLQGESCDRRTARWQAGMLWELVAALLWLIAREPSEAAPRMVDHLCSICNQWYTGPFPSCNFCREAPSYHHVNCCLNHPRHHWRAQQPAQGTNGPAPGRPTFDFGEPARPKPRAPTFMSASGQTYDEPMVSWQTYGLTVPLRV